jgi:hypothetical protein
MDASHAAPASSPLRLLVVTAVCAGAGALGGSAQALGFVPRGPVIHLAYLPLAIAAGFVVESRWAWIAGSVIFPMDCLIWFQLGPYPPLGRWTSTVSVVPCFALLGSLFLAIVSQASTRLRRWWRWTGTSKESGKADDSDAPDG